MTEVRIDLDPILDRIGALVKRTAIINCPIDKGETRASIGYRIKGNTVILFATSPQAEKMEWGSPPSILSKTDKEELMKWSERHNASPRGMVRYIEKHGIRVGTPENPMHITSFGRDSYRPFLRPAVYSNIDEIKNIIIGGIDDNVRYG